ncbi:protein-L-isoaspartate O-methyltransferase family protein [Halocatena halophila]|uniref:protein-L-isoaspartate O-methyltransferase family protein n=1 Tax=Halocatena halophila TaxID=2814576 RepID=UPI002ED1C754
MDRAAMRDEMVASLEHEAKGYLESAAISVAMRTVPRELFVPSDRDEQAYTDQSFEQAGSRILSPSRVGQLLEALSPTPGESVLIVGSGVGYTVAIVAEIVGAENVQAIDIDRQLVTIARRNLDRAGYGDVLVDRADGTDGYAPYAPYDRILVEAAAVRPPATLLAQLNDDGILVLPTGTQSQILARYDRDGERVGEFGRVSFNPLLLEGEQHGTIERNRTHREDQEFAARELTRQSGWEHNWIDWTQ